MKKKSEENSLKHFGILGMRWGVRRYQNYDGSLTNAGRIRYDTETGKMIKSTGGLKGILASAVSLVADNSINKVQDLWTMKMNQSAMDRLSSTAQALEIKARQAEEMARRSERQQYLDDWDKKHADDLPFDEWKDSWDTFLDALGSGISQYTDLFSWKNRR